MAKDEIIAIIGGGLAGSEAAWQALRRGIHVRLYEMRPRKMTAAHKTGLLGELVCSNSLRSANEFSAPGLLKKELSMGGSLIMEAARQTAVPAGSALAVDRRLFGEFITERISSHPDIEIINEEVDEIRERPCIVATGPLTSEALSETLGRMLGADHLYFYDAIAPIVDADSIDHSRVFRASRYGKGGDDYLNCPMNREEYERFYNALIDADSVSAREFEDKRVFEGCMPIEVMARRGKDTPRFGPMKPVGIRDPGTGSEPFAVVQLRVENREETAYNIVGFQTRLKWPEQKRVFSLIPGLERAEFLRFGSIHRNTFINGPGFLNTDLTLKVDEGVYIAGQLSGVEGYIESTAMGLISGINVSRSIRKKGFAEVPVETAHGALLRYITGSSPEGFQPSNINFGLFPSTGIRTGDKRKRREEIVKRALNCWEDYLNRIGNG
ncbi:MAG TPA: methylenetetrahydrofolate--tRNA-(uracil(54)-C(5))-methyltransferase (FADH(2)-oxidizing) TrmFO [Nitrospirae bacterium]|nr:methylenetetrahydrofolate--tRNA-(uracil-5-)-methyltransferase TrmFO [bacterium BMS3Abin08]HDO36698.1 methylenetetrahydrofolate--tRNA-(uracil(54)-C(5))-methyltransferase (FADH(2)-oxidizing) TrmFO [Nitrospirota bacterium]HDY71865.1 methylenetetrahydrofolate--tRNA-(uracil(54)-C(5))-methyltransferase (FADH(2)-oxidizing) TrmFO [Nitrospirota bacterium]